MTENPYEAPRESDNAADLVSPPLDKSELPSLNRDSSFWSMTATQFLGAFNDNLFKQLMLLLAIPVAGSLTEDDQQGLATIIFALPFILFSGFAGFLSDRFSKRNIIIPSKVAEIAVMGLGLVAFAAVGGLGYTGLLVVLFLMGAQSAFFGPGKYGILPEMLREKDLPRANGIILMTTFIAIICGTAVAGLIGDAFASRLWIGSLFCIGIAVVGTLTSLGVRHIPAARPDLRFQISALTIPPETRKMLGRDRPLLFALLASCLFWLVAGVAIQAVNSFAMVQLGFGDDPQLGKTKTSLMTAMIAVGIAAGSVIAGRLSHGRANPRVVTVGLWGIVICLAVLAISLPGGQHLLGFGGSFPLLALLGMSAGFFAIPIQVFMQSRPPEGMKGRMYAVVNQANFIAILVSGVLYGVFDNIVTSLGWPRSPIFGMMALLMLPAALLYRLNSKVESAPVNDE